MCASHLLDQIKRKQLAKGGARLEELLNSISPQEMLTDWE
jgi:hypothetical protein